MRKLFIYLMVSVMFISCKEGSKHEGHSMTGMNMTDDSTTPDKELQALTMPPEKIIVSTQETVKPTVNQSGGTLAADGYIAADERRNNKISARYGGRVEKLYIKYTNAYVKKGQRMMDVHSPELNTIQEEYIHHIITPSDSDLADKVRGKLLLLGLTNDQINAIKQTRQILKTVTIFSPYEGYILLSKEGDTKVASPIQSTDAMGNMAPQKIPSPMPSSGTAIREGGYITAGQTLFTVNDLKEVWGIVALSPGRVRSIQKGMQVAVTSQYLDERATGIIGLIEPEYAENQKFTQVRVFLKNPNGRFKVNELITAQINGAIYNLSVPNSAVIDLGKKKVVWVKTETTKEGSKVFQARTVTTGTVGDGFIEITTGLTASDEIAKDAGYLIGSENLIRCNDSD